MIRHCADCKHVTKVASGQLRCGDERAHWVCDRFEWRDRRHAALEIAYRELTKAVDDYEDDTSALAEEILLMMDEVMSDGHNGRAQLASC